MAQRTIKFIFRARMNFNKTSKADLLRSPKKRWFHGEILPCTEVNFSITDLLRYCEMNRTES